MNIPLGNLWVNRRPTRSGRLGWGEVRLKGTTVAASCVTLQRKNGEPITLFSKQQPIEEY